MPFDVKGYCLQKNLKNLDEQFSDKGVFLFNDENVKYCSEGFVPSKETYMIFYHFATKILRAMPRWECINWRVRLERHFR